MSQQSVLNHRAAETERSWETHVRTEFSAHAPDEAIATMTANPLVNQVPVLIGGSGGKQVYEFYEKIG